MVKTGEFDTNVMPRLTEPANGRTRCWCAGIILVLVCTLTVSVATRYVSSHSSSAATARTLQKATSAEPSRLRLIKGAASWAPPLLVSEVHQSPVYYPRSVAFGPSIPSIYLEDNLYNRPPPVFLSL
jgi:hypothetical protein